MQNRFALRVPRDFLLSLHNIESTVKTSAENALVELSAGENYEPLKHRDPARCRSFVSRCDGARSSACVS
jgi:hypothetical protein